MTLTMSTCVYKLVRESIAPAIGAAFVLVESCFHTTHKKRAPTSFLRGAFAIRYAKNVRPAGGSRLKLYEDASCEGPRRDMKVKNADLISLSVLTVYVTRAQTK